MEEDRNKNYFDIWGDNVDLKDLCISMGISVVFTLGGFLIAWGADPQPLIFGLVGGLIGFFISVFIIRPKRKVSEEGEEG
ncbi:hypothetical protein [Sporosarcina sp. 6E9]|uniref:hypothetical protein n=1 Tax=Sporosarcina sp. 6E9 TaxID=2819235 RepID=UPI001B30B0F3|nr:hypothetical protein [Sporosarcina sp. 6E9]